MTEFKLRVDVSDSEGSYVAAHLELLTCDRCNVAAPLMRFENGRIESGWFCLLCMASYKGDETAARIANLDRYGALEIEALPDIPDDVAQVLAT